MAEASHVSDGEMEKWGSQMNLTPEELEIVKRIRERVSSAMPDRLVVVMAFNRHFDEQATVDRLQGFWVTPV